MIRNDAIVNSWFVSGHKGKCVDSGNSEQCDHQIPDTTDHLEH